MYQSPVAAMAELVANAWDADAEHVSVVLPGSLGQVAEIVIADDGIGMTFEECQGRYLNVGWCRRGDNADEYSVEKHRPILGRKGKASLLDSESQPLSRLRLSASKPERKLYSSWISANFEAKSM